MKNTYTTINGIDNKRAAIFLITHTDGSISLWRGITKQHVKLLARIETNLGWIHKPKFITEIFPNT